MNTILNKIGAMRLTPARFFGFWAILFALVFTLSSCSDDLNVQQSYPFTVEVMPYGDKIKQGETVELRFEIKPEGNYANTLYTTAKALSNSLTARCWSTTTACFSKARPSA